jgi:hypothetical protein
MMKNAKCGRDVVGAKSLKDSLEKRVRVLNWISKRTEGGCYV